MSKYSIKEMAEIDKILNEVCIRNFAEMQDSCFEIFKDYLKNEINRNDSFQLSTIQFNNGLVSIVFKYKNEELSLGTFKLDESQFYINLPKFMFRRSFYNSINDLYATEKTHKNIMANCKYLEDLPDFILNEREKEKLVFFTEDINIYKLTLQVRNLITINRKTLKSKIDYQISLYENINNSKFYVSTIHSIRLKNYITKYLTEFNSTMERFGKPFTKLNKKEMKILEIEFY